MGLVAVVVYTDKAGLSVMAEVWRLAYNRSAYLHIQLSASIEVELLLSTLIDQLETFLIEPSPGCVAVP